MADTVTVKQVAHGPVTYVTHLTGVSDATGEAAVTKIDISTFETPAGEVCTYTAIDKIEFAIEGEKVKLEWNHTAAETIAVLAGTGCLDWCKVGGLVDGQGAGGTGDIQLSTIGAVANSTYDITIHWRPKA